MNIVKSFVLFICLSYVRSARNKYCEICTNHTLCVYPVAGPSIECSRYNAAVSLTASDRIDIVNKINERRSFIAMGRLHLFPEAANMKQIMWSTELATFAQRWVDQCDQSVKPDKKDACRDLAQMKVGQNIATVVGLSPGINVKSLIDMWFMENIFFTGTVTYYNKTSQARANQFAQLIWAQTEYVGCSKAQFYNEELKTIVLRLVCNFAPSGNHHGKPIYNIGLPSTQCSRNTVPSRQYLGLCQRLESVTLFTVETSTASNFLRILNLSNDSMKQELDPNNSKQINMNNSEIDNKRHQKTRHAYLRNNYGAIKRDSFHIDPAAPENYKVNQFTPERGHSRMYHGHQTRKEPMYSSEPVKLYTGQNFRRVIDFSTIPPLPYTDINYRKYFINSPQECTRKIPGCCPNNDKCPTNECTRGQSHNCCQKPNICPNTPCPPNPCANQCKSSHQVISSCSEHTACSPLTPECAHNSKCPCSRQICPSNPLPEIPCAVRRSDGGDITKSTPFNHYDLPLPNIEIRSGDSKLPLDDSLYHDTAEMDEPILGKRKDFAPDQQVKILHDNLQNKGLRKFQDSLHYFDSSARKIRDLEEQTFKPFWQVDEYSLNKPSILKSIRYTTLNRKQKKPLYKQTSIRLMTSTETITVNLKDMSKNNHVTEKYLSFDELMHLRKLNNDYPYVHDARRKGHKFLRQKEEDSVNTTLSTVNFTVQTPFQRLRYCTRKITCTWSARTKILSNGSIVIDGSGAGGGAGGGGIDGQGNHPPGYVAGCTRTSTCTRDFMDRNKYDTLPPDPVEGDNDGSGNGGHGGHGDEDSNDDYKDYCQRRDLNLRRRDISKINARCRKSTTTLSKETVTEMSVKATISNENIEIPSTTPIVPCICYKDIARSKRNDYKAYEEYSKNQCVTCSRSKCPCGSSNPTRAVDIVLIFLEYVIIKLQ